MQKKIDVTTARRQFGTLLDQVFYRGDIIVIERKGRPLAQLVPFENEDSRETRRSALSPERRKLLEDLHSLPVVALDRDPTEVLRNLRQQKRMHASAGHGN